MTDLLEAHQENKQTLKAVANSLPSPPSLADRPNPLLNRTKLKSSRKAPKSKKAAVKQVEQAKKDELSVVSSGIGYTDSGVANGEEGEVLDLADQLLEQLQSQSLEDGTASAATSGPGGAKPTPIPGAETSSLHQHKKSGDSLNSMSSPSPKTKERLQGLAEKLHLTGSSNSDGKKVSRQQARKLRKVEHTERLKSAAEAEVAAENDQSVEMERKAIEEGCKKLGVRIKEIEPDGHCLFSAIADQANFLKLSHSDRKETYGTTRYWAANFMRKHPADFLPFLESEEGEDGLMSPAEFEKYCDTIEKTGEWGGQPEITALSKYFQAPIHVLQAGTDLVKWGEDLPPGRGPMLISYHRKMYGLGEHYNSLRPATNPVLRE